MGPVALGAFIGLVVTQFSEAGINEVGRSAHQSAIRPKVDAWALERALLSHEYDGELYRALKEHQPKLFNETITTLISSPANQTVDQSMGLIRQKLIPHLQSRAAYLPDADLVELFSVSADTIRELAEIDPYTCLQYATGGVFGDITHKISSGLRDRDRGLILKMVRVKPRNVSLVDASAAVSLNNKIAENLSKRFGGKLELISGNMVPKESYKEACLIYGEYSAEVTKLDLPEAADLIRVILVEPSRLDYNTQGSIQ
jgi:hypothetical protein